MKIFQKLCSLFFKKQSGSTPVLIIRKEIDDSNTKEYNSIEEAISDIGNDPNVSAAKLENLKIALKNLKNKSSIKIRNGKILK